MPREIHRPGASARRRADALAASLAEFSCTPFPKKREEDPTTVFIATRPIDPLHDYTNRDVSLQQTREDAAQKTQE